MDGMRNRNDEFAKNFEKFPSVAKLSRSRWNRSALCQDLIQARDEAETLRTTRAAEAK
jgi:hypothetical protein